MDRYEFLIRKLSKEKISKEEFCKFISEAGLEIIEGMDYIELLRTYGLPIREDKDGVYLKTLFTPFKEQVFCFVDIETNGNSPVKNQIIEIGAIKYQNGKIIDKMDSLIYCDFVPEYISKITNITVDDLKGASSLNKILYDFKLFLGDAVFVAHNVNFDFNFISASLERAGYGKLLNRKLCTIDLARKTIKAERYGLAYLIEHLNIDTPAHHRAHADALSSLKIFEESLKNIPSEIETAEDLLFFAKPSQNKRKKKKTAQTSLFCQE